MISRYNQWQVIIIICEHLISMYSKVFTIARFTIIESLRNRFLLLSFLVIAVSFALVEFIGDLAIAEHRVTQVAILAAFLRMSAVVIVTLFVVSSSVRELNDKTLEMILAMPVPRGSYYLGKLLGSHENAHIAFKAEDVLLSKNKIESSARNSFEGIVENISKKLSLYELSVKVNSTIIKSIITRDSLNDLNIESCKNIWITFKSSAVKVFPF